MTDDPLLIEFAQVNPTDLKSRLTDAFGGLQDESKETQVFALKESLIQTFEDRIDALDQD